MLIIAYILNVYKNSISIHVKVIKHRVFKDAEWSTNYSDLPQT